MSQKKTEPEKKKAAPKDSGKSSAKEKTTKAASSNATAKNKKATTAKKETVKESAGKSRASESRQLTSGKQKSSGGKSQRVEVEVPRSERLIHQVMPFVWVILTMFLCACYIFNDNESKVGVLGGWIHDLFTGLFGWPAFLIPLILLNLAVFWRKYVDMNLVATKLILSFMTVLFTSSLVQVFVVNRADAVDYGFLNMWRGGVTLKTGGILGGYVGNLSWQAIGFVGSLIVMIPGILVLAMFALGVTPRYVWTKFRYWWGVQSEKRAEARAIRQEQEAERLAAEEERLAQQERERYARRMREEQEASRRKDEAAVAASAAAGPVFADDLLGDTKANGKQSAANSKKNAKHKNDFIDLDDLRSSDSKSDKTDDLVMGFDKNDDLDAVLANSGLGAKDTPKNGGYKQPELIIPAEDPKKSAKGTAGMAMDNADAALIMTAVGGAEKGAKGAKNADAVALSASETKSGDGADSENLLADLTTLSPVRKKKESNPLVEELQHDDDFYSLNAILNMQPTPEQEMSNTPEEAETELGLDVSFAPVDGTKSAAPRKSTANTLPKSSKAKQPEGGAVPAATALAGAAAATNAAKDEKKPVVLDASGAPVDDEDSEPVREYVFPPIDFLAEDKEPKDENIAEELRENAQRLMATLSDFNVRIKEITYSRGPTITRYELKPDAGIRVRSIANLVDDIALNLATSGVRIEAPIPDKPAVGVEVPNRNRATVYLRDLIDADKFHAEKSRLTAALGMDVAGKPVYFDISKMPHLLIAGATGMGKSVCINSLIVSLLYKAKPDEVRLILIDPKKVEFNIYRDIPLLYTPIVVDAKRAAATLACAVAEMERRFELIEMTGVRDIKSYNAITAGDPEKEHLPHIVIIIDELAELMMVARDQVETSICRIAQKARAAGMHLIIGTQRPSVDVITGVLKANIPSRIACTVASQVDSRTIIDIGGAEKLIGRGDMLFAPVGSSKPMRVQGAFVSEGEVESIVDFVRTNNSKVRYNRAFIDNIEAEAARAEAGSKGGDDDEGGEGGDGDSLFAQAVRVAVDNGKISTSLLQRKLSIGYGRAAKLIDQMEEMGYVSEADGNKPRRVLIDKEHFLELMTNGSLEES